MLKIRYAETLFYTLAAGLLILLSWLILSDDLPVFLAESFFVKARAVVCSYLLAGYGAFFVLCALLSFALARRGGSLGAVLAVQARAVVGAIAQMRASLSERFDPADGLILAGAILLGILVRAIFLSQPMRLDESYTFLYYLNEGRDLFHYNVPNNHVLHTILAKFSVLIMGTQPVVIRLPAFIAGILCIPAIFLVGKAFHKNAGVLAALAMAVFPYMILYSTMARGYSLIVLLTLLLLLVGRFYLEKPSLAGCILISITSALGLLTIPTMLFAVAGIYLWLALTLLIKSRNLIALLRDFIFPICALTALLTIFFYTPVLISSNGADAIFSNRYVDPSSWEDFFKHIQPHYRQIISDFFRDVPGLVKYAGFLLALIGLFVAARRREWISFLLVPSMVFGGLAVFFAKQAIPFVRTWIYLIPFFLLFVDLGYSYLTQRLQPKLKITFNMLILIVGLVFVGPLISGDTITKYPDTGSFPEAATVAKYLKPLLTGDEFIAVMDPANFPLYYYLCAEHAPIQNKGLDPATVKRYFVVKHSRYQLSDLTNQPAEEIFEFRDATVYTSVSKNEPIWQGFVFECRDTHP